MCGFFTQFSRRLHHGTGRQRARARHAGVWLLAVGCGLAFLGLLAVGELAAREPAEPVAGTLSPKEVVAAQLTAFSALRTDPSALAAAYGFASAENRKNIGSIENFRQVVSNPPFRPLLDNRGWLVGRAVATQDGVATVLVTVNDRAGRLHAFRYFLRRTRKGGNSRWFVDSVLPVAIGTTGQKAPNRGGQVSRSLGGSTRAA